ncbi:unnamed protein product [Trifolium pratense]|uniref:Uncharacterized protein n=1 Tax=Trifolium pratense TaxID=57577 RepID=A0ACB0LP37_TRIPR|nr:unnamed protein product [Trifolium pratense]
MLYYSNEFGVADGALLECKFCQEPRYRVTRNSRLVRRKPIPRKAMFYLPIIPRLQRLYASMQTASKMTWHRENYERRKMSGELRHPSDGMAWKHFDQVYPEFASEPRNVQLGLCSNGFTPYTQVSVTPYSCWPVLVTPYNLPPDMCMSKPYMFLAAVIPGSSSPTVGIDIYLQPLIDDLKRLWNGVATQLRLPPHRRDNEEVRRNKMSLAFVKNAGGANRGRKFAAGCTSSLYASDPTGFRDVTYTSSSSSSTGRSRPAQREETDDEYEARMRATYREEFREEYEATFDQRVDQRVQHVLQEFFAQQRAPAGVGSSSQGSARQNQNAGEQEYRPDLNSMVNLNQLPEYREGDPVLSMSIEDMSQMLNEPIHLQFFDPVGQTSGSSSGGSGRNNQQTAFTEYHRQRSSNPYQQDFIIPHENPNQPQDNFFPNQASFDPNQAQNFVHRPVARPPRTSLPPVIINEGGRGRGQGRPRQPTYSGKGKRPLYQPPDQS